jgi:hypothetical protein
MQTTKLDWEVDYSLMEEGNEDSMCFVLRHGLPMLFRLAWILQSSCLSLSECTTCLAPIFAPLPDLWRLGFAVLPRTALNTWSSLFCLSLLRSWDYSSAPLHLALRILFKTKSRGTWKWKTFLKQDMLSMVTNICNLSYLGDRGRRTVIWGQA